MDNNEVLYSKHSSSFLGTQLKKYPFDISVERRDPITFKRTAFVEGCNYVVIHDEDQNIHRAMELDEFLLLTPSENSDNELIIFNFDDIRNSLVAYGEQVTFDQHGQPLKMIDEERPFLDHVTTRNLSAALILGIMFGLVVYSLQKLV